MSYHFSKIINGSLDQAKERITEVLKEEGFGILTEINIANALKNKLDVDFRPYIILGACHPGFAHKALLAEPHIGTMLPCNVIMQQHEEGKVEVSAVDPIASMNAVKNESLGEIAGEVQNKLKKAIEKL